VADRGPPPLHPLVPLALFALTLGYFALFVTFGLNTDDEGVLLAQYYRTALGEVPVRDFHIGYTPGGYYLNAALLALAGPSVLSLRWALATCHAAVAVVLLLVGRRLMPALFACLPPLVYCAIMPFYPGEFASFNIPYPAWYVVLALVAGLWMLLRFLETDALRWVIASGLAAGVCFSVKPNVGLFQLAMSGLVLLLALEPRSTAPRRGADVAAWWALLVGIGLGLTIVFASQASARDVRVFLLPIAVLLGVLAARRVVVGTAQAPRRGVLACGLVFAVAVMAPVLPWVLYFLDVLGPPRFARALLFIGSGFEHLYYEPFHDAGPWAAVLTTAAATLVVVGLLARARRLSPAAILAAGGGAVVAVALAATRAPMPEGLAAAIVSRVEDVSYFGALVVHWLALASVVPALWRPHRPPRTVVEAVVLAGALTAFLQLYPRSDFTHLVVAVPLTLVVGTALAARFAAWFPTALGVRAGVRAAMVAVVLAFLAVRVAPNLAAVLTWENGPAWRPRATLELARAPLGLELGRASRLHALHDTVAYLQINTRPGERIFTFPAIEGLNFLADRRNATRHGYFFAGWPGHDVEAEVLDDLAAAPPRLMVVLHAHQFYFAHAPAYYFALRRYVRSDYRPVAAFGPYVVLAHRTVADHALVPPVRAPSSTAVLEARYGARLRGAPAERLAAARALAAERLDGPWPPLAALLDDDDPEIRGAAIAALAEARDAAVAVPLAATLGAGRVPPSRRLAVLRQLRAVADVRSLAALLPLLEGAGDPQERDVLLDTVGSIGLKLALHDYWLGAVPGGDDELDDVLSPAVDWVARLADPGTDPRLRLFLARALPRTPSVGLADALGAALDAPSPELRAAALAGLMRLPVAETGPDLFMAAVGLAASERIFAPSLLMELYERDPDRIGVVGAALRDPRRIGAAAPSPDLAWVASATGDPRLRDTFVQLLGAASPQVRMAAIVGLGRIADPAARPWLARLAADDADYEVRAFATRVLGALGAAADVDA
jgi:HEAT repeat protein